MSDFQNTCLCPDAWCPMHAKCASGHSLYISDPDELAWCDECQMIRLPVGVCSRTRSVDR